MQGKKEKKSKANKMDLNEPPPEFDYDFLQELDGNPTYCTQVVAVHDIKPAQNQQNPVVISNIEAAADVIVTKVQGKKGELQKNSKKSRWYFAHYISHYCLIKII